LRALRTAAARASRAAVLSRSERNDAGELSGWLDGALRDRRPSAQ
jgi:hypothetical protein